MLCRVLETNDKLVCLGFCMLKFLHLVNWDRYNYFLKSFYVPSNIHWLRSLGIDTDKCIWIFLCMCACVYPYWFCKSYWTSPSLTFSLSTVFLSLPLPPSVCIFFIFLAVFFLSLTICTCLCYCLCICNLMCYYEPLIHSSSPS